MMPKLSRENTISNASCLPRHLNIQGFQKFNIKSNSPRTLQACQELGIDPIVLELKEESDFKQNDLDEEIIQLRYQHYLNRNCSQKQLKEGKRQSRGRDKNY
ncbi:unnamed protein product (macronuclear) [Paramecium tetraurelia]|uniref:Uncharacterized protein n=1 Tax=Paramecium tetraurelia TaxID=5888 RepID=A0CLD0_PARTE|nr:uncharacterized protein GSPATT00008145001 [Paramecium tetraurelia]CAK71597.1 unnamed protein product [Paramecium tetraurelia]|eukprot:XP_001438994.1 hypothetical protein (macronuclear) [Paramecium tetraurelia strain d4-2]